MAPGKWVVVLVVGGAAAWAAFGRLLIPEALNKLVQILECCLTGVDNVMPLLKLWV